MRTRQRLAQIHAHPHFPALLRILKRLQGKGFVAVLAGGCVRDSLLGLEPKDLDLATSAPPDAVEGLFERTLAVGKAFGTIVVAEDLVNFEVTTFRKDGPYVDGRHPSHVEFSDMQEDARRRDFTINALFYDPLEEIVIDFVAGRADLERGLIRTVGRAEERFGEDKLRMLRAVRFVAQTGFELDSATLSAIQQLAPQVQGVSMERIFNELRRLLGSPHLVRSLQLLIDAHLGSYVWPELNPASVERVSDLAPMLNWENSFAAAMLTQPVSVAVERLRLWKAPRDSQRRVQLQIEGYSLLQNIKRSARARVLGSEVFAEVLQLARHLPQLEVWIQEYLQVADRTGELPKPWLSGQDLLQQGVSPGEKMGLLLKTLFEEQLEGRVPSKAEALKRVQQLIS
jgi:poly(A) polymerase